MSKKKLVRAKEETLKLVSLVVLSGLALVGFTELFGASSEIKFVIGLLFVASLVNNTLSSSKQ